MLSPGSLSLSRATVQQLIDDGAMVLPGGRLNGPRLQVTVISEYASKFTVGVTGPVTLV